MFYDDACYPLVSSLTQEYLIVTDNTIMIRGPDLILDSSLRMREFIGGRTRETGVVNDDSILGESKKTSRRATVYSDHVGELI